MKRLLTLVAVFLAAVAAHAHVGSKDVFQTLSLDGYKLFVTVRMPSVIPGIAYVEVKSTGLPITSLDITPLPITGPASRLPPTPDTVLPSAADPTFFQGKLWMMASGSWQIRLRIHGSAGDQTAAVPVPSAALTTLPMRPALGVGLALFGFLLLLGMVGIVAAAAREADLPSGVAPDITHQRRGRLAASITTLLLIALVLIGRSWWKADAATARANVFRPMLVHAALTGGTLDLLVTPTPGVARNPARSNDDFLPDHGHLIHLYAIRFPAMDAAFHLHPTLAAPGDFRIALPAMPSGDYKLFGDVVHSNGFAETLQADLHVPSSMPGAPLSEDDASAHPPALSPTLLSTTYTLPDGYTMHWDRPAILTSNTAYGFTFSLRDPSGHPATDMQPYLGMSGHAAFVKQDATVFAHTHPEGSAAMPALTLVNGDTAMPMDNTPVPSTVEFPYGFPSPGRYRIFVQMKHSQTVETGVFDALVQ